MGGIRFPKMRIAVVAPPWFAVPPTGYGGIELVVSLLTDGLVDAGHDVTLFASSGSQSKATLVSGGAGVTLTLPFQCPNATGTVTWCVTSGSLVRYSGSACSGSGLTLTTIRPPAAPTDAQSLRPALTGEDGH